MYPVGPIKRLPKILPFGDSITNGVGSTDGGGYRSALQTLAAADGYQLNFVGSLLAGPAIAGGHPFNWANEGHPGWTIAGPYPGSPTPGLTTITPSPALDPVPDIVLLMIGINDANYTAGLPTMFNRWLGLANTIRATLPKARLCFASLCTWNFTGPTDPFLLAYCSQIQTQVAAWQAAGETRLRFVNQLILNTATDFADAVHPNDLGYAKLASAWYPAFKDLLA